MTETHKALQARNTEAPKHGNTHALHDEPKNTGNTMPRQAGNTKAKNKTKK